MSKEFYRVELEFINNNEQGKALFMDYYSNTGKYVRLYNAVKKKLIIYNTANACARFFFSINSRTERSEDVLERIKRRFLDDFCDYAKTAKPGDTFEVNDIIETRRFEKVNSEYCRLILSSVLKKGNGNFEAKDMESFLKVEKEADTEPDQDAGGAEPKDQDASGAESEDQDASGAEPKDQDAGGAESKDQVASGVESEDQDADKAEVKTEEDDDLDIDLDLDLDVDEDPKTDEDPDTNEDPDTDEDLDLEKKLSDLFDELLLQDGTEPDKPGMPVIGKANPGLLVGLDDLKREMLLLTKFTEINKRLKPDNKGKRIFPFHYIFTMQQGMGLTTILKNLAEHLNRCGLIRHNSFIEYTGSLFPVTSDNQGNTVSLISRSTDGRYKVGEDYGVIAVNISEQLSDPHFRFERFMDVLWECRGKVVFALIMEDGESDGKKALIQRIKNRINCHVLNFPPYAENELVYIAERMLLKYGLDMDAAAKKELLERIGQEKEKGTFENLRTVQKLIEEVRVEKHFNVEDLKNTDIDTIYPDDISAVEPDETGESGDSWKELDEIIGLDGVKAKLKEIIANARIQRIKREQGLVTDDASYHMMFTGNPGTGKTTVARILGKMFREVGILRKGELHEVARDNLVGRYVGHTAPMVRECIREALGSVLFIDEAYSLCHGGDDRRDFGFEAIEVLIKEMEDKRDDLIVIMAGYTKEMNEMMEMNAGISDRIPYKIEFPDYNSDELYRIFMKFMGGEFIFSSGVEDGLRELFSDAVKNAGENFGNGRFARNASERLKMKQSLRLCTEKDFSREDLLTIMLQDVTELRRDEDIRKNTDRHGKLAGKIGFRLDES